MTSLRTLAEKTLTPSPAHTRLAKKEDVQSEGVRWREAAAENSRLPNIAKLELDF